MPYIGDKIISNLSAADIKKLINQLTEKGYAFSTVKQTYNLLSEYFRYLEQEDFISKNPMLNVGQIKKANFYAKQGKELKPTSETITVFTDEEVKKSGKNVLKNSQTVNLFISRQRHTY